MDAASLLLAEGLVAPTYVRQGAQALAQRRGLIRKLLSHRRLPPEGWDDATIEMLLQDLALMDSNNFMGSIGVGEREARCASALVSRRHYGFSHGIGRSGNITDEQPKAAGSTLAARLTTLLVKDALQVAGLQDVGAVTVLPVATGMALTLSMNALKAKRPATARYVLWPRIDQKTCLKAVAAAGLEIVVVPSLLEGDQLRTDLTALEAAIDRRGADAILCVLSTTSCFAPRGPDRVEEIAKLCERKGVGHIINNAYGVQAGAICSAITRAWRRGRVDAVVQSTDKNFMVPVGGAVVAAGAKDPSLIEAVNAAYPGRASISPLLDVLITLLSLGTAGWKRLLVEREEVYTYMHSKLTHLASQHGERVLTTPHNPISLAFTLSTLKTKTDPEPPPGIAPSNPEPRAVPSTSARDEDETTDRAGTSLGHGARAREVGVGEAGCYGTFEGFEEAAEGAREATREGAFEWRRITEGVRGVGGTQGGDDIDGGEASDKGLEKGEASTGEGQLDKAGSQAGWPSGFESGAEEPTNGEGGGGVDGRRPERRRRQSLSFLGSMLFMRRVSGCRVIPRGEKRTVAGITLHGFGSSHDDYPHPYLTAAAALGTSKVDVDSFVAQLNKCIIEFRHKHVL